MTAKSHRNVGSEIAFLARAMKARRWPRPSNASLNEPGRCRGRMRSSWLPACNARSPHASPTAAMGASAPLGIRACQTGHRVAFAAAAQWVPPRGRFTAGRLQDELV